MQPWKPAQTRLQSFAGRVARRVLDSELRGRSWKVAAWRIGPGRKLGARMCAGSCGRIRAPLQSADFDQSPQASSLSALLGALRAITNIVSYMFILNTRRNARQE